MERRLLMPLLVPLGLTAQAQQPPELPPGRILGRVVDALGDPVPAAEVWITERRLPFAQTRTEGSGIFQLPNLPSGEFEVHARAPDRMHVRTPVRLSPEAPLRAVELRLFDAALLHGRVVADDGGPVAGARILVRHAEPRLAPQLEMATSAADGGFALPHAPLGEIELLVFAAGHDILRRTLPHLGSTAHQLQLVRGAPQTLRISIRGATGAQLQQTTCSVVLGHHGHALPLPEWWTTGRPDARGDFVLADLPSDVTFLDTVVRMVGGAVERQGLAETTGGSGFTVRYRAAAGPLPLRGQLTDAHGNGIPHGAVRLLAGAIDATLPTDATGRFEVPAPLAPRDRFRLLPADPGLVRSCQGPGGRRRLLPEDASLEFLPGSTFTVAAVPGAAVSGRVLDARGSPVAGLEVGIEADAERAAQGDGRQRHFVRVAVATTDRLGRYRILIDPSLDPGLRVAGADSSGAARAAFLLQNGAETALPDLSLAPGGRVEGTLHDRNGAPLVGAVVALVPPRSAGPSRWTLTDREGAFALVGIPAGIYDLSCTVTPSGGAATVQRAFEVEAGATIRQALRL